MTENKASAPVKDQPHPFQTTPEVPVVFARAGAEVQGAGDSSGVATHENAHVCDLCGAPRSSQIHIVGEAEAQADSPKWG
jgi:hypothetical protein